MTEDFKFIGWKVAQLLTYVIGFPFLFTGAWMHHASDLCHDRAIKYDKRLKLWR